MSLLLHAAAVVIAFFYILSTANQKDDLGQGSEGADGMDKEEAEAAPTFRIVQRSKPPPQKPPKETGVFQPMRPKVLKTLQADVLLPDIPESSALTKPIQWSPPSPKKVITQAAKPLAKTTTKLADKTPSKDSGNNGKGKASGNKSKAAGTGDGGGRGEGKRGMTVPKITRSYPPSYPAAAKLAKAEGLAIIKVYVSTKGSVIRCNIYRSAGRADLDGAALRAVKGWRFTPAEVDGVEVLVSVRFKLK